MTLAQAVAAPQPFSRPCGSTDEDGHLVRCGLVDLKTYRPAGMVVRKWRISLRSLLTSADLECPLWVESGHWPALSNSTDRQREWIKMRLEAEGKSPVENPSESKVRALVASLKSYGPCSFASITDEQGSYLQVGGGGQSCLLERRDAGENRHFRAYRAERSAVFPDGTVLSFSGGDVPLRSDEWMSAAMVAEAFSAFLERRPLPPEIMWREMSELVKAPL